MPRAAILPTPRSTSLCQTCLTTSCNPPATPAHFNCHRCAGTGNCRSAAGAVPQLTSCCTPPAMSAATIVIPVQALAVVNQIRELCPQVCNQLHPPAAPALLRLSPVQALEIANQLRELYPNPPIPLDHTTPFQLLVAVMLSAQVWVLQGAGGCGWEADREGGGDEGGRDDTGSGRFVVIPQQHMTEVSCNIMTTPHLCHGP